MAENHIHRLIRERDEARAQLLEVHTMLADIERYLYSAKFQGENGDDSVYIRTDIGPKITAARFAAIIGGR